MASATKKPVAKKPCQETPREEAGVQLPENAAQGRLLQVSEQLFGQDQGQVQSGGRYDTGRTQTQAQTQVHPPPLPAQT